MGRFIFSVLRLIPTGEPPNVALHVVDGDTIVFRVFEMQSGAQELFDWIGNNWTSLVREEPPGLLPAGHSIAERIASYYASVELIDELEVDELYGYRCRHGLRFALRGTDIPDVYIGLHCGVSELSLADGERTVRFELDLGDFLASGTTAASA